MAKKGENRANVTLSCTVCKEKSRSGGRQEKGVGNGGGSGRAGIVP